MAKKKTKATIEPKKIVEDTTSGSLAYNRLDMQVSQAIHMAVELYNTGDFLFVLDHYDDITIFDKEDSPAVVSYYQLKTNEESITIDAVVRKEWLPKLYLHQQHSTWPVQEIGLITNCVLKITSSKKDRVSAQSFTSGKTPFTNFDPVTISKIKTDIGKALSLPAEDIDLSRFVHLRTTLTLAEHRSNAEQAFDNFLHGTYPNISLDMAKTIFNTLIDLLSRCQSCEGLSKDADFETVRKNKGISKNDFARVIDAALLVCIPNFEDVKQWSNYVETDSRELSLAYAHVIIDQQQNSESQKKLFEKVNKIIERNPKNESEAMLEYARRIKRGLDNIPPIYDELYIMVVVTSVLINRWRYSS